MEMMRLVVEIQVPATRIPKQHEKTQEEETEDESRQDREGAEYWYCHVPFPGVKYYFYPPAIPERKDPVKDTGSSQGGERGGHHAIPSVPRQ